MNILPACINITHKEGSDPRFAAARMEFRTLFALVSFCISSATSQTPIWLCESRNHEDFVVQLVWMFNPDGVDPNVPFLHDLRDNAIPQLFAEVASQYAGSRFGAATWGTCPVIHNAIRVMCH